MADAVKNKLYTNTSDTSPSNIASFYGKAYLWGLTNPILNPCAYKTKKVENCGSSIFETFLNNDLEKLLTREKKGRLYTYCQRPLSFVFRISFTMINTTIIAPTGILINGAITVYYTTTMILRTYRILNDAFLAKQENWAKIKYYAQGLFTDSLIGIISVYSLPNHLSDFPFLYLFINVNLCFITPLNMTRIFNAEQLAGIVKAKLLYEKYGLTAPDGKLLSAKSLFDDEHNNSYNHFLKLCGQISTDIYNELQHLKSISGINKNVYWGNSPEISKGVDPFINSLMTTFSHCKEPEVQASIQRILQLTDRLITIADITIQSINCKHYSLFRPYNLKGNIYLKTPEILTDQYNPYTESPPFEPPVDPWEDYLSKFDYFSNDMPAYPKDEQKSTYTSFKNNVNSKKTPVELFGFKRGETPTTTEIKKIYMKLCLILHPDKIPANSSDRAKKNADSLFKILTEAYSILTQ